MRRKEDGIQTGREDIGATKYSFKPISAVPWLCVLEPPFLGVLSFQNLETWEHLALVQLDSSMGG